jgi:hypothetical protein
LSNFSGFSEIKFKEFVLDFITNPNQNKTKAEDPDKVFIRLNSYNNASEKPEKLDKYVKEVYLYIWNKEGQNKYESTFTNLSCKKREKVYKTFPFRLVTDNKLNKNQRPKTKRIGLPPFGGDVKE